MGSALMMAGGTSVVVGASRGIGLAMATAILERSSGRVVAASRRAADSAELLELSRRFPQRLTPIDCDVTDVGSLRVMAAQVKEEHPTGVGMLLNVAGLLHEQEAGIRPERRLAAVDPAHMARVLSVNAMGPVLTTQALHTQLKTGAVVGNVSARVGSIGDNGLGGWWS